VAAVPRAARSPTDGAPEGSEMKFEYLLFRNRILNQDSLNELGEQGWELVANLRDADGYTEYFFKRLK
jgi:hypothetical protein